MATEREYQSLYDRIAALRETVASRLSGDLVANPQLADAITKQIDDMLQGVVDADAKAIPPPDKSFFFARYQIRGDRLEVNQVDSERVAKLVIDGKLDGTVSKSGNDLHVFVRGNRARMLEIVRTQSIFQSKSPTKLERRKQTLDEFERSVLHAQHNKSRPE